MISTRQRVLLEDRLQRLASEHARRQARVQQRAEEQDQRTQYARELEALGEMFIRPGTRFMMYRDPGLLVRRRLSVLSVVGYVIAYNGMDSPGLYVSLTGRFYFGQEEWAHRVDPWEMDFVRLGNIMARLHERAKHFDLISATDIAPT